MGWRAQFYNTQGVPICNNDVPMRVGWVAAKPEACVLLTGFLSLRSGWFGGGGGGLLSTFDENGQISS